MIINQEELLTIFNVSLSWANNRRREYLISKLESLNIRFNRWYTLKQEDAREYNTRSCQEELSNILLNIRRIRKALYYLKYPSKAKLFDVEQIKQISIIEYLKHLGISIRDTSPNRAVCSCPIHNEKTGSFVIYKDTNSFYCFGCQEGGSVIDLVMKTKQISFYEALKELSTY